MLTLAGTLGLLTRAKKKMPIPAGRPLIAGMQTRGFRLAEDERPYACFFSAALDRSPGASQFRIGKVQPSRAQLLARAREIGRKTRRDGRDSAVELARWVVLHVCQPVLRGSHMDVDVKRNHFRSLISADKGKDYGKDEGE